MTNKYDHFKNLCGLHPAAFSASHGPKGFLALVKSPSILENILPVAGEFSFLSLDRLISQYLLSTDDVASTVLC